MLLAAVAAASAQEPTAPDSATATAQHWLSALAAAPPGDGGSAALVEALTSTHDVGAIAAAALGALDDAARERLAARFASYLAARELACLGGPGVIFDTPRAETEDAATSVVTTATADEIPLQLHLQKETDGWRITAVSIDGRPVAEAIRSALEPALDAGDPDRVGADLDQQSALFGASPSKVVGHLQAALLTAMKDAAKLGYAGRDRLLAPVVVATHDLPFIGKFVMRRQWDDLDEPQRQRFQAAFRALSLASYAARFDGWSGESFEIRGEQELRGDYRLVKSELVRPDDDPIQFDYMLHREDCRWQIVNIIVDGVSDLATKQAEYKAIMESDGFDELVDKIEQQTAKYRTESED